MNRLAVGAFVLLILATLFVGYFLFQTEKTVRIAIGGVTITVEIAETPADRQKGLSGRDRLASDRGMLFIFEREDDWSFWMKDMRFSLDIIWFNSTRQAVHILQNLQPCTPLECLAFTPPEKAKYVLEVNAGFVKVHNISPGETFTFLS